MKNTQLGSTLKYIAGAVIVIAAALIMFPLLVSFALSAARLAVWIIVVLLAAHALRYLWSAASAKGNSSNKPAKKSLSDTAKKTSIVATLLLVTCTTAIAQPDSSLIIPAGTVFEGRIDTKIGSAISHTGQKFHIIVANPVLANGNTVLIPAGARVLGEVVEAIPADHIYHQRGTVKPKGKLRIQLTALEMPNGAIFPLVATVANEYFGTGSMRTNNPNLGHGVGYVGSSAGFNQVTPQSQYTRQGLSVKPQLVSRDQMLHDPLYGVSQPQSNVGFGARPVYRELKQHGNDTEIVSESPLNVRLDAALRIPYEVITESVHGGKGLPAALGLDREDPNAAKHKHGKPAPAPTQYKQEQPGTSFIPGAEPGSAAGTAPSNQQTGRPLPAPGPASPNGDAGF